MNTSKTFDERGNPVFDAAPSTTEVAFKVSDTELREAPALRAAWLLRGVAWSADHSDWTMEPIPLAVRDPPGALRDEALGHACRATMGPTQRAALAQHVTVLPQFDRDDVRHDPQHRGHGYDPVKSHIPRHAERILGYAVPEEGGMTWWARCACQFYHRFMGSQQQPEPGRVRVHWNATTNPNATGNQPGRALTRDQDVPHDVKNRLAENARYHALADGDCGCREIRGPSQP